MSATAAETRNRLKDFGKTSDLFNIAVDDIEIDPDFNLRLDTPELAEHIDWLVGQIKDRGFLRTKPLIVRLSRDKRVFLVDGHCRLAAVKICIAEGVPIETLPCLPEGKGVDRIDRTVMMFAANAGLNFSPLEQAIGVKRLLSYGMSEAQVGKAIGRTRQHVANLLELAGAPEGVKVMVVSGVLSATEAVKTIRRDGDGAEATLKEAETLRLADGRKKITARHIPAGKSGIVTVRPSHQPVVDPVPLRVVKVPLQVAASHVVDMAKGLVLPGDLRRAIDALFESLS
jgi:ParB-like chromosome segregation protein Spo0J